MIFDAAADNVSATTDRAFNAPSVLRGLQGIKVGAVNCYCIDWRTKSLIIFPKNIANGGQPTPQQIILFRFPSDVNNPIAVAIDEANNRGYVADGSNGKIHVFALDTPPNTTAAEIKAITNPANATTLTGLCIDANEILYAIDNVGPDFHCFPASTPDGTAPTGDALVQFDAPADLSMPQGLDVLGDTLFCLDVAGFVVTLSKKTANGDTAAKIAKFDMPPEVGAGTGLGIMPETATATPLKDLHYNRHPVNVAVKIHDQDVTDDTVLVEDISQGIDYPNLTEFRVGEASVTLRDVHGDFSPNNPSNFFTQHGGQRTGRNSPIEIEALFIVDDTRHTATIFKGTIIRLVQDAKAATVKAVCSDNFGDMRKKTIADFGISRHFMLTADTEQSGGNGYYPIMQAVMPASDGSVSLARRTGETLKPAQKLETEGTLNPRNFIVDAAGVRTEGGLIVDRQVGYPQLRMKSPFRYRHIQDVIDDILTHAGITDSEIEIPAQAVDAHFSSNGRVNYDLIGVGSLVGSSNPITWRGYVTDFLHDGGKWFFLFNSGRNNINGISQVIEYDAATRIYTQLHKFPSAMEVWKFTKVDDVFYILASTGGNYDANEQSSENKIIQLDISGTPTATDFVSETATLQPQLSHYYAGVGSVHHKPDSRRQLIYRQNALYYAYCDRGNSQFGVAKATAANVAPTSVVSLNIDNYENHGGLAFDIDASGVLHGATTFLSGAKSQTLVFKKTL